MTNAGLLLLLYHITNKMLCFLAPGLLESPGRFKESSVFRYVLTVFRSVESKRESERESERERERERIRAQMQSF